MVWELLEGVVYLVQLEPDIQCRNNSRVWNIIYTIMHAHVCVEIFVTQNFVKPNYHCIAEEFQ